MIRREEARLRHVFRRILLVSLAAPGSIYACNSASSSQGPAGVDAGEDATGGARDAAQGDAAPGDDAGVLPGSDAATGPAPDASDASSPPDDATGACDPSPAYFDDASYFADDAGPDAAPLPAALCYTFVDLPCGLPAGQPSSDCFLYLSACNKYWTGDGGFFNCQVWGSGCVDGAVSDSPGDPATLGYSLCSSVGRRPAGLEIPECAGDASVTSELGDYFAQVAHLEAASVEAFTRLREELVAHEAPTALVRMAARSGRDEVRHARIVGRLARRFGGTQALVHVAPREKRSLEEMACENAVEGCVRETFGALLAQWQAAHAEDAEVRAAMRVIAADETRHAALAWAIARWASTKLDVEARARVSRAQADAVRALLHDASCPIRAPLVRQAGLPTEKQVRALAGAASEALWGA
jgi:hypothetical protein